MRNLIYLLIAGITLTSCVKKSDFAEYQLEQEQRVNALESRQKDLEHELEVLQITINSEVERLELVISVVDAENDAELLAGLQNANDELKLAVEQLENADTSNLTVALNAIASAEERLTDVIVDNLESVTEALNELTDVDENLQAQIDLLLNDVNTLSTSLQQETVDIYEAIQNAIRVVEVTRVVMQDSTVSQEPTSGSDAQSETVTTTVDASTPTSSTVSSSVSTPTTVVVNPAEANGFSTTLWTDFRVNYADYGFERYIDNSTYTRYINPDWGLLIQIQHGVRWSLFTYNPDAQPDPMDPTYDHIFGSTGSAIATGHYDTDIVPAIVNYLN